MTTKSFSDNRLTIAMLIIVQIVGLIVVALISFALYTDWHDDTIEIYFDYSTRFLAGEFPYRDFAMEYPPMALIAFTLPHFISTNGSLTLHQYSYAYLFENVLFSLAISTLLLASIRYWHPEKRERIKPLALFTVLIIICAPLIPWRYDLFPALLTFLAMFFIIVNKPALAGVSIGIAVAAKLYPVITIPIFVMYLLLNKEIFSFKRFIYGGGISILTLLPFFILAPDWMTSFLSYHQLRGFEIESTISGLLLLGKILGIGSVKVVHNFSSFNISSAHADILINWIPYITITAHLIIYASCFYWFRHEYKQRSSILPESFVVYILVSIMIFIATNKVFSPQYIIWLIPFVPLIRFRYASILVIIALFTNLIFPSSFALLINFNPLAILLLNIRNILFIMLIIWILFEHRTFLRKQNNISIFLQKN